MSQILLIDGNSVGHASDNTTRLTARIAERDFETQAIFGFLRTLRVLLEDRPASKPVVLWDGRAQFRFDLYPDYKGNRTDASEEDKRRRAGYLAQKVLIQRLLRYLAVPQFMHPDYEADDLAATMSAAYQRRGYRVTLATGDKDWLQLIGERVEWFDHVRRVQVNPANLFQVTGYKTTEQFLQGKVLTGDSSDQIKGVGGIGKEGAPLFIAQFGSVEEFWRQCDCGSFLPTKKAHISLWKGEGRVNYERNMKLMRLDPTRQIGLTSDHIEAGAYDEDGFINLAGKLGFASILADLPTYLKPFKATAEKKAA